MKARRIFAGVDTLKTLTRSRVADAKMKETSSRLTCTWASELIFCCAWADFNATLNLGRTNVQVSVVVRTIWNTKKKYFMGWFKSQRVKLDRRIATINDNVNRFNRFLSF